MTIDIEKLNEVAVDLHLKKNWITLVKYVEGLILEEREACRKMALNYDHSFADAEELLYGEVVTNDIAELIAKRK